MRFSTSGASPACRNGAEVLFAPSAHRHLRSRRAHGRGVSRGRPSRESALPPPPVLEVQAGTEEGRGHRVVMHPEVLPARIRSSINTPQPPPLGNRSSQRSRGRARGAGPAAVAWMGISVPPALAQLQRGPIRDATRSLGLREDPGAVRPRSAPCPPFWGRLGAHEWHAVRAAHVSGSLVAPRCRCPPR